MAVAWSALAGCSSSAQPADGPSESDAGSDGAPSSAPGGCASDGSDLIVAGTFQSKDYDSEGIVQSTIYDVFVPTCQVCSASTGLADGQLSPSESVAPDRRTWSSAWAPDHSKIVVLLSDGSVYGTVDPDGNHFHGTVSAAAYPPEWRLGEPDRLVVPVCGGYVVFSSSNYTEL
jgi:hypothetical protein